jgi:hypothetical protein
VNAFAAGIKAVARCLLARTCWLASLRTAPEVRWIGKKRQRAYSNADAREAEQDLDALAEYRAPANWTGITYQQVRESLVERINVLLLHHS